MANLTSCCIVLTMNMAVQFYEHQLGDIEKSALLKSIDNPILTSGPICKSVELQLTEYFSVRNAKLVNSWTNGALATLMSFGVGPGDEVIIPSMTFIACANIVELLGAKPVFCDVSEEDLLVSVESIRPLLTAKTKVIMVVHMYGQMCDVKSIYAEFHPMGIRILEDCAHSFESSRDGYQPGTYSDAAVFSFYATKNITCGEGGAVITNDDSLYSDLTQRVLNGMSAGAVDRFKTGSYSHWTMDVLGIKANLPDILASLLPSQIKSASNNLEARRVIAERYDHAFNNSEIRIPLRKQNDVHAMHLYPIWIPHGLRDLTLAILSENRIGATVNFRPVNEMTFYMDKYLDGINKTPVSSSWGAGVLSLPLYPGLSLESQDYVIEIVQSKVFKIILEAGTNH
jgi:UDP-4-amino-4-deoxy-L-arabinose-oxoglutarate aminotransferase